MKVMLRLLLAPISLQSSDVSVLSMSKLAVSELDFFDKLKKYV